MTSQKTEDQVVDRHANDPQLKAMRHLLKSQTDPNKIKEIQSFIDKRLVELNNDS